MSKPLLLLSAPVATQSGYGHRSRDIAYALIKSEKYDVKIWSTRWGSTPMNALDPQNPKHKCIMDCLLTNPQLNTQPEIYISITVPNEFQRIGKYNIGITAGIETTIASAPWIEGCNRMDLILVSSEHSKKVMQESSWQKVNDATKQVEDVLKLDKPIEILFEGVDLNVYKHIDKVTDKTLIKSMDSVKENWCFLYTGHWLNGDFGEDRKNVSGMVRTFYESFKNKDEKNQPALILKTSSGTFSALDRDRIINKLTQIKNSVKSTRSLPNVYVLHGDLSDVQMNELYNHPKVKAHITFTKGEGFGRPLAEASLSEKPIIATNWSGHVDFLKHAILLPGTLTNVHPSAAWENVILQESQWMTVDYGYGMTVLKHVHDNYKDHKDSGKRQAYVIKKEFSLDSMCEKLDGYLTKYVPEFPKQVQLKLPQLKKIELPKLKKIETNEPITEKTN
jgi:glycosyltransferase involved in cell wall biosynthesis